MDALVQLPPLAKRGCKLSHNINHFQWEITTVIVTGATVAVIVKLFSFPNLKQK